MTSNHPGTPKIPVPPEVAARHNRIRQALDLLDQDKNKEFLLNLCKDAVQKVEHLITQPDARHERKVSPGIQFYVDLEDFMYLVNGCLVLDKSDLLDWALASHRLPTADLGIPKEAYAQVFEYIRQRLADQLSGESAEKVDFYLNHLVRHFS